MSVLKEEKSLTWFQKFCINVIKCGPIPRHVAVIMDGNRRYARQKKMEIRDGHREGAEKLKLLMLWCREFDIKELTVYAFSIENFKRNPREVKALMNLVRENFQILLEEKNKVMELQICVRAIGNLHLFPADIKKIIAKVVMMTKDNKKYFLNVACAYASREEITNAIKTVVDGVRSGFLQEEDINQELLSNCMYTNHSPDPDLLVRTSGEVRFSDFLLWQTQYSQIYFEKVCWPHLTFWNFLLVIFRYQQNLQKRKIVDEPKFRPKNGLNSRSTAFISSVDDSRIAFLEENTKD